jgi:hypothetical protein
VSEKKKNKMLEKFKLFKDILKDISEKINGKLGKVKDTFL